MLASTEKLHITEAAAMLSEIAQKITIREIYKLSEKVKWMDRFIRSYSGTLKHTNSAMYSELVKFFVAVIDGVEVGYIRIANFSETFSHIYDGPVWHMCDAYVKPRYRNLGVLREMIKHMVDHQNAKSLKIETTRLYKNRHYYYSLGFTYHYQIHDSDLSLAFIKDFEDIAILYNDMHKS